MAEPSARFVSPSDVETQLFEWGSIKWLSESRVTGVRRAAGGIAIVEPGKGHSRHHHPTADEIVYVISGEGQQMVEDDSGTPIVRQVRAGDLISIPEGVFHELINTTWEPLRLLVVYAPGGPEALLRELPECTVVPPGGLPLR